jgi:hypothetical protein
MSLDAGSSGAAVTTSECMRPTYWTITCQFASTDAVTCMSVNTVTTAVVVAGYAA